MWPLFYHLGGQSALLGIYLKVKIGDLLQCNKKPIGEHPINFQVLICEKLFYKIYFAEPQHSRHRHLRPRQRGLLREYEKTMAARAG